MKSFKVTLIEAWTHYRCGYVHNERDAISKIVHAVDEKTAILVAKKKIKKENGYKNRDFQTYYPEHGGESLKDKKQTRE